MTIIRVVGWIAWRSFARAAFLVGGLLLVGLVIRGDGIVVVRDAPPSAGSVLVTFKSCGQPYPCEVFQNLGTAPVRVTFKNSSKEQTVDIPAGGEVTVQTDGSDNT